MKKRFELNSGLQGETLVRKGMHGREAGTSEQIRIAPDMNVIKIGGHGAIDYGREVMHPLCEEIGTLSKETPTPHSHRWGRAGAPHHGYRDGPRDADRCTCGTLRKDLRAERDHGLDPALKIWRDTDPYR